MKSIFFIFYLVSLNSFSQSICIKTNMNFTGFCTEYCFSDSTKWIKEFQDGQAVGIWMYFDEQGDLKMQLNTSLKRDSLNKIHETFNFENPKDVEIKKDEGYKSSIFDGCYIGQEAKFPGKDGALLNFMKENMVFSKSALDKNITGKVYVKFCVEKDGSISEVKIVKGIENCPECSEEVIRLLKLMPNWIPAMENGKPVKSHCQIPFNFNSN